MEGKSEKVSVYIRLLTLLVAKKQTAFPVVANLPCLLVSYESACGAGGGDWFFTVRCVGVFVVRSRSRMCAADRDPVVKTSSSSLEKEKTEQTVIPPNTPFLGPVCRVVLFVVVVVYLRVIRICKPSSNILLDSCIWKIHMIDHCTFPSRTANDG